MVRTVGDSQDIHGELHSYNSIIDSDRESIPVGRMGVQWHLCGNRCVRFHISGSIRANGTFNVGLDNSVSEMICFM